MNFDLISQHIVPRFVIDIGARLGDWAKEAKAAWPEAQFLLIEGNLECQPTLDSSGFHYAMALLSDKEKVVDFYTIKDCPMATGASYYREKTPFFADDKVKVEKYKTTTLDYIWERAIAVPDPHPLLVKIDTQGSELDILAGAEKLLKEVDAVVMEISHVEYNIGAPSSKDAAIFMAKHGFYAAEKLGDIIHPIERDRIVQTDMLYLKLKGYGG